MPPLPEEPEVLPRPPEPGVGGPVAAYDAVSAAVRHWAPGSPLPGPAAFLTAQHHRATVLHERFLRLQALAGERLAALRAPATARPRPPAPAAPHGQEVCEVVLDPDAGDHWVTDHCPTWTVPALPLMSTADLLARAAGHRSGRPPTGLRGLELRRWLPLPGPTTLRLTCEGPADRPRVTLSAWQRPRVAELARFAPVASATAVFGAQRPPSRFPPLPDARPAPDPYESGDCFHGPRFQYLTSSRIGDGGSSGTLDAGRGDVPRGLFHQGLLDAATHIIPHTRMRTWSPGIGPEQVTYPHALTSLHAYAPLPDTGRVDVEARFAGFHSGDPRLPAVDLQLCTGDRVLLGARLVLVLVTAGRLLTVPAATRRAFLRDRRYSPALLLSDHEQDGTGDGGVTVLRPGVLRQLDFLPGTVAAVYGLPPGTPLRDSAPVIAAKEHVARRTATHPCRITVDEDLRGARVPVRTGASSDTACSLEVTVDEEHIRVRDREGPAPCPARSVSRTEKAS
ncbi:polyketide synthase dehydratase domain-containing protein [Streptomyces sclerotialus]|uniref:polyketide synthase dehydratase domain-containing protein n=1 Tax=Streptomyces sclerotialus TaxID=1957 RepID=UPI0018CB25EE